jgi:polyhydroxyalkanoate synthesis regulator phasin
MATQQEQFRQNVAAAQDQVEKISAQARQATRETAQAAQQTQQALAQNTERLSQQGGQVAATAFDTAWETWMAALGMVSWTQDQAEQVARQLMEQGRISREEGTRLLRDLGQQAKRNQAELQSMIQESVRAGLQSFQFPESYLKPLMTAMTPPQAAPAQGAPASEQIDDLARKLDALDAKVSRRPVATATAEQLDELNRKVEALNRKVDALNPKPTK